MRCILCSRGRAAERDSHTKRRWMVALASSILPSIIIIINLSTSVFTSANRLAATLLTHHDSNDFNLAMQEKSSLRTLGVLSEFSRSSLGVLSEFCSRPANRSACECTSSARAFEATGCPTGLLADFASSKALLSRQCGLFRFAKLQKRFSHHSSAFRAAQV